VGLGDAPRRHDPEAVAAAVGRAGAEDVVAGLPAGLDTQLGPTWPGGGEISFGQWQTLALARGFMRAAPLVLVLDEPTAALDAETEHALFERYAAAARAPASSSGNGRGGGITILVSHRFSTVRMADLIVVLDGARVAQTGSHEDDVQGRPLRRAVPHPGRRLPLSESGRTRAGKAGDSPAYRLGRAGSPEPAGRARRRDRPMQVLRPGSSGEEVRRWQYFLIGRRLLRDVADGIFGPKTLRATRAFQRLHGLERDGVVGPGTVARAIESGFDIGFVDPTGTVTGPSFPPRPAFPPLTGNRERAGIFGRFAFVAAPSPRNQEAIRIAGDWEARNLVRVEIPALAGVKGAPSGGKVRIHKAIAGQFTRLWSRWKADGVARLVLTWDGSFVPRFVRGSRTVLSNHSFGSAFDINAAYNPLGAMPALAGHRGSVRDLVMTANEHGFYWGGHYEGRPDGMHFEAAKIL
jgi:peptidoglycan hydrolase-like protein with peptidoglycan-binding domain